MNLLLSQSYTLPVLSTWSDVKRVGFDNVIEIP